MVQPLPDGHHRTARTLRKFRAELLRLTEHASIPLHAGTGEKTHVLVERAAIGLTRLHVGPVNGP